jgi:hypothetical protein
LPIDKFVDVALITTRALSSFRDGPNAIRTFSFDVALDDKFLKKSNLLSEKEKAKAGLTSSLLLTVFRVIFSRKKWDSFPKLPMREFFK